MSVLSAYCVFILLHCVSLCSVVFLYSLSATFCLPVLTSGPFFQCEALFLHLYLRHCPHFVEVLSSCLFWGFVLIFYIEASSSLFYIEALSSSFILRLCPHSLFWGFVLMFILRLCPHILYWGFVLIVLYWGFVLIFYFEALSSCFILRLRPHCFILRLCSSVWGFGPHCYRPLLLCLYCLFDLFAVICVWFCLFVFLSRVTRCQYYLIWISIHIFHLFCLFFSIYSCYPLFWFTCSYINFNLRFCWPPCFDMCGHYSPAFIVMGHCNTLLYALLSMSHQCF